MPVITRTNRAISSSIHEPSNTIYNIEKLTFITYVYFSVEIEFPLLALSK